MKKAINLGTILLMLMGIIMLYPTSSLSLTSITVKGGDMQREIHLGMSKQELITMVGAPDRIKSEGRCFHYDTFDVSVFLDKDMKIDRMYMGRDFQGTVQKLDSKNARLTDIFHEFGDPQATERITYAPSVEVQTKATDEIEEELGEIKEGTATYPMEYRGNRKLYELYGKEMVMKYKYVLDDDGIAFYLDHNKNLYATVIYPPRQKPAQKPCEETIAFEMIHFDFDKYTIKEKYIPVLNHYINYLNKNENVFVTIEGHTDGKGTDTYNMRLSDRRAQAVYNYFINKGVSASRLKLIGYGKAQPIAPNTTTAGHDNPEGRAQNRRVQFQLKRQVQ
ncbi:MAG: OmpA family protein [Proteobacteria bacterium]|nr:OmpA family protein [Pseudomonadota bacterium]